jgi:hypothetical protein
MLKEKSEILYAQVDATPAPPAMPAPTPAALKAERQEQSRVIRGVLAAAAVVLGAYLVWRLLQMF